MKIRAKRKTNEEFINEIKLKHPTYILLTEYLGCDEKVKVKCEKHNHEFYTTPKRLLESNNNCIKCIWEEKRKEKFENINYFISRARKIHGDKYDYSKVEYVNSKTEICIICPEHGEFCQKPIIHLSKGRYDSCPICSKNKSNLTKKMNNVFEKCKDEALKYKTKKDFYTTSPNIYATAIRKGWIDKICQHMDSVGNKYYRCIYVYEFKKEKSAYVGLTYDLHLRDNSHKTSKDSAVYRFCQNKNIGIPVPIRLTEYIPVSEAKIKESEYVEYYRNLGYTILNRAKTGGIGSSKTNFIITKELCLNEALKFDRICDFRAKKTVYFNYLKKKGWYNDVFEHILNKNKIVCFDYDGNFLKIYDNQRLISCELKINYKSLNVCINNPKKTEKHKRLLSINKYRFMSYLDWISNNKPIKLPEIIRHPNVRTIIMLSIHNEYIGDFESITSASRYISRLPNVNSKIENIRSSIIGVCTDKRKTAYGYKWMYKEDYDKIQK